MHLHRTLLTTLLFLAAPATRPAPAQTAGPTLPDILLRLQENAWDYRANVPDFFADEHVVSSMKQEGARDRKTTTDSVFRLARSHAPGDDHILVESREVRLVNGKQAKGSDLQGPAIFGGGFSTAPSVVSLEMSRCFDYTLEAPTLLDKQRVLPISYALSEDGIKDPSCPGPEKQSGRAFIDPNTLRLLRIEMIIPNHKDDNGVRMLWRWSVDFAPVTFDARQFWLPKTITSYSEANDGSAIWQFTATYTNYHKLEVRSRILPP